MVAPSVSISFLDRRCVAAPGGAPISFGRSADLEIDANPAMHRIVGRVYHSAGAWWIANDSRSTVLELHDQRSNSSMTVAPGTHARLGFTLTSVRFNVGPAVYELLVSIADDEPLPPPPLPDSDEITRTPAPTELTPEQRLLVVALAEPRLRTSPVAPLPTNRAVAQGLGWSDSKFNRKLDAVCTKLDRAGVPGLVGTIDMLARDRRQVLVDYAVYGGLVDATDLRLLDAHRATGGE